MVPGLHGAVGMTPAYECLLSTRANKDGEQQRFGPVFWPHGAGFWAALASSYVLPPEEEKQWEKKEKRGSFRITKQINHSVHPHMTQTKKKITIGMNIIIPTTVQMPKP